ncbi:hypothetical protein JCM11641_005584 [Rhodosporidiobolus odoratus]
MQYSSTSTWASRSVAPPVHPTYLAPAPATHSSSNPIFSSPAHACPPLTPSHHAPQLPATPQSASIRRARSSGAMSTAPVYTPYSFQPSLPPSPVSPITPQRPTSSYTQPYSTPVTMPQPGYAGLSGSTLSQRSLSARSMEDPATAVGFAYGPRPVTSHRRQRGASVQATYVGPTYRQAESDSTQQFYLGVPEYTAPTMSYSQTVPTSTQAAQPAAEEVCNFFRDMTDLLGEDTMAALSPTSAARTLSYSDFLPPPPTASSTPSSSRPSTASVNVSGVLLTEAEYQEYAASPSVECQQPLSQPFITPRAALQLQPFPPRELQSQYLNPNTACGYGYEVQRPLSAPPTPGVELVPTFPIYASSRTGPYGGSAPLDRRRGSSLELSAVPRSTGSGFVAGPLYGYPSKAPLPGSTAPSQQNPFFYRRPSASYPSPAAYYPPPPMPPSARPTQVSPVSPTPAPRPHSPLQPVSPTSSNPKRPTPSRIKKKPSGVAFINFSAADSRTLLSGVAPSGTSKKRQREEDEAREREAKRAATIKR